MPLVAAGLGRCVLIRGGKADRGIETADPPLDGGPPGGFPSPPPQLDVDSLDALAKLFACGKRDKEILVSIA